MDKKRILVVDDDRYTREPIKETLRRKGFEVEAAGSGAEALELFSAGCFDLVVSDLKMPGMTGVELLEKIKHIDPEIPFLVITAFGAVDVAVDAMKKGAFDFLQKSPNMLEELELSVERTLQFRTLITENKRLRSALARQWDFIGGTAVMEEIRTLITTIAPSRSTVLVTGESGTGKELIARALHMGSPRQSAAFVKVNCAALPEGLIESELFGHEKGAFTGALKTKPGKFELAHGGTLLLDEIGEMNIPMQAKLLRVLQEREINKVGGDDPIEINVRVVVTTNRELESEIKNGRFREDLYYRLNVFHIHLPPLRERKADIMPLAEHFIAKFNEENGFNVSGFEDGCIDSLLQYSWPGNIRELENTIERAVVLTRTGPILRRHCTAGISTDGARPAGGPFAFKAGITIADAEKELIIKTLEHCQQNRTKAAEMLDISIRTLRNKLNEYDGGAPVDAADADA